MTKRLGVARKLFIMPNRLISLLLGTAVIAGCSGKQASSITPSSPTSPSVTVNAITISGNTSLVAITQTTQLAATANLSSGASQNVTAQATWESSNTGVATVTPSGLVTSGGFGVTDVRATYQGTSAAVAVSVAPPASGTLLRYDVDANVPEADLVAIKTGFSIVQTFLATELGGDIPVNMQLGITVRVVATGLGNPSPNAGGACCTALDDSGAARPFFDVKHRAWDISSPPGIGRWSIQANKEKTAAHEYTHDWAWSLGGLTHQPPRRTVDWYSEGLAEYIAYATMIRQGQMQAANVDAFMLSSAIVTGQAARCLAFLENSNMSGAGLWPGHMGFLAVQALVARSSRGILSVRVLNQDIGSGMTFDQAFEHAFGLPKSEFYRTFPDYVASIGGPRSCS